MNSFDNWDSELYHHGIKGQKWGQRRFQNEDGSLTAAGRARYYNSDGTLSRKGQKAYAKEYKKLQKLVGKADISTQKANAEKYDKRARKSAKIGGISAGVAAIGLGGSEILRRASNAKFKTSMGKLMDDDKQAFRKLDSDWRRWNKDDPEFAYNRSMENLAKWDREYNSRYSSIKKEAASRKAIGDAVSTAGKVAAAAAIVSGGVYAYNKIQSHMAKTRLTEAGHSKAVAKAKEQADKMREMFGNIKYSDLIKKKK